MRFAPLFAFALALSVVASSAAAQVYEPDNVTYMPNGLLVPQPAPSNETSLNVFFVTDRGEAIDWHTDAHTTPNAFSPLCGFTATFVFNQAGSKFGLSWYNETGSQPQSSDLHNLVPANSLVGTMFSGTSIKNDPAYLGGLVGFALVGGETHYTNPAYNTVCSSPTACNPAGHWITALIYASKNTPNAYYIGFEDGNTSASGWNNDGDFNDDVFFLTGLTCSGGGQTCDTGKPGICGPGVTQCTGNGVVCQQLSQPAAMETCNGLDDDCNGTVDEGDICPSGFVCDKGACVQSCQGGEFNCPPAKVCAVDGHCVDPTCKDVNCDPGKVCMGGVCNGPCDNVVCPFGQVCRVGACVDPCAGVTCDQGQVCDGGVCVARCDCLPCAAGKSCDTTSGLCGETACVGAPPCDPGKYCLGGTCVDACMGVMCPTGQACMAGQCVQTQGGTGSGGSTSVGFGVGVGGNAGTGGKSGAGGTSGSHATSSGSGGAFVTTSKGTCGCEVVGNDDDSGALAGLALAALGLVAARRRR